MKDRFGGHASSYAVFRPSYPASLYNFILDHTPGRDAAWDCACGNGQVAKDLSPHFGLVHGTDISRKQLDNAFMAPNIRYSLSSAEKTSFSHDSFDLVAVGQALHWFKLKDFFAEVSRVGKKGSTIAVWGYGLVRINNVLDPIIDDFYVNVIGPYWDPERRLIDDHYNSIEFPFPKILPPAFDFSFDWDIEEFRGYITTWSAVQKFIAQENHNPVDELIGKLTGRWKGKEKVTFPLFLLLGHIQ